jgi:hypothetical protein
MPRVAGLNLVAVLVAAVVFYFIGFLVYGLLLGDVWAQQILVNHGVVAADQASTLTGAALQEELAKIPGQMDMAPAMSLGFVISLVTAIGLALVLKMVKPASITGALGTAFVLWIGFAATTLSYNVVYSSESPIAFAIDLGHLLVAYLAAAAVLFLMDGKAMSGAAARPATA